MHIIQNLPRCREGTHTTKHTRCSPEPPLLTQKIRQPKMKVGACWSLSWVRTWEPGVAARGASLVGYGVDQKMVYPHAKTGSFPIKNGYELGQQLPNPYIHSLMIN